MDKQHILDGMRASKASKPICILQDAIKEYGASNVAKALGVHPAHMSNLAKRGVSPTLRKAMVKAGIGRGARRQHRRAALFGYDEEGQRLAAAFDRYCEQNEVNLTQWARKMAASQLAAEQWVAAVSRTGAGR